VEQDAASAADFRQFRRRSGKRVRPAGGPLICLGRER
jgi:hypothetical protein